MPKNNNQKGPSAAARLSKLPLVGAACTKLSVLYIGTKFSHPALKCVCEGLESGVTAILSPVIVKLEPQISIANDLACKSLDWLESTFPVVHTPAEQVVAAAKNRVTEIQELVSIAANGSLDCMHIVVTWLSGRMQQAQDEADQPLVERAISVASMGLDSALVMSETLVDQVLPPTNEDKEEESKKVEGFEVTTPRRSYPVRLVGLVAKTYRRMCHMVTDNLTKSSGLVLELQTSWQSLVWSVRTLPQNVQHQLVSAFFFLTQMYNLNCPPTQNQHSVNKEKSFPNVPTITTDKAFHVPPQAKPPTFRQRKPIKSPIFDNGCNVKGCVGP